MPSYSFACSECGSLNKAKLEAEVTPVQCAACGNVFMVQRPESVVFPKNRKKKASKAFKPPPPPPLTFEMLKADDDRTSSAVIAALSDLPTFHAFAKAEMKAILARDAEDDQKLGDGINLAVAKGAVPPKSKLPLEALTSVDVLGKSADQVAAEIVAALGDAPTRGCVLILQGLSGTGKGTTVSKLARLLPRASTWSNGNIFRALTLLAVTYCESHGVPFAAEALTPSLLADLVGCLHFEAVASSPARFDVRIEGLGIKAYVSQIENTVLKEPRVGKAIPTVARVTQGEVIAFAARCVETMRKAGMNVLLEGRAQTLDYVRSPYRFELILSQPLTIGLRRAAQRAIAHAKQSLLTAAAAGTAAQGHGKPPPPPPTDDAVRAALEEAVAALYTPSSKKK